jgi:LPS export ABC transporter protein LptC
MTGGVNRTGRRGRMWFRRRVSVALVLAALVMGACGGGGSEEVAGRPSGLPDEVIAGFVTEESDHGRAVWRLTAPRAERFNDKKEFILETPKIEFFDEYGSLQSTLTSDAGEFFEKQQHMLAYGNVVVVTVEGDVLETDTLRYLVEEDRIVNDCFNKLTSGNDVITGYGLECDHNLSSVVIKRNVEGTVRDEENRFIEGEGNTDEGD